MLHRDIFGSFEQVQAKYPFNKWIKWDDRIWKVSKNGRAARIQSKYLLIYWGEKKNMGHDGLVTHSIKGILMKPDNFLVGGTVYLNLCPATLLVD